MPCFCVSGHQSVIHGTQAVAVLLCWTVFWNCCLAFAVLNCCGTLLPGQCLTCTAVHVWNYVTLTF